MNGSGDILVALGGLASGVSMATFMLLSPTSSIAPRGGSLLPTPSPILAGSPFVGSSHTGFDTSRLVLPFEHQSQPGITAESKPGIGNELELNLARELREVSGLGVASLARIVGISRTRYHLWLKDGGIGPGKIPHVMSLIALLRDLRPILGSDVQGFVRSQSPAGPIEQLLHQGETKAVLGLALHPAVNQQGVWERSVAARQISGVPGWIRQARRLAWEPAAVDDVTRQQMLDEFGASSAEVDGYVAGADEVDDHPIPGAVHVVYES